PIFFPPPWSVWKSWPPAQPQSGQNRLLGWSGVDVGELAVRLCVRLSGIAGPRSLARSKRARSLLASCSPLLASKARPGWAASFATGRWAGTGEYTGRAKRGFTGYRSFRSSLVGLSFAYCDFYQRNSRSHLVGERD